jgi:hypothetical protein
MRRHIKSDVNLIADTDDKTGGAFDVIARTSNSPLSLVFPDSPADHTLKLAAHTSNGRADVRLHSSFEGAFHAKTSSSSASVSVNDAAEDPKGKGRKRAVSMRQDKYRRDVSGNVTWGERDAESGKVDVTTSSAPVFLSL